MDSRVCVFEWRYGSEEMRRVFSLGSMVRRYVEVEKAIMRGLEEAGIAPRGCSEVLERCSQGLEPREVYEMERVTGHDIASLAYILGERCGECGRYVHLGATSYDVVDTAWALAIREALGIVKRKLRRLIELLSGMARRYADTLMVGRTHGQHALPITLGFKFANYVYELARSYERLCDAERRVVRGKVSGAVGTMAAWRGRGLVVEEAALRALGLEPHAISTQVAPRDGFAELVAALAILGSQLDRLAVEVRELSRPEIAELAEGTGRRVGSSTMPHKRNPTRSERISGLARFLRSFAGTSMENIVLWHERDLSNSSYERLLIPHVFLAVDQVLEDTARVLEGLQVFPENMRRNLELSRGAIMSEAVMVRLVEKGMARHEAHKLLMELSRRALDEGRGFGEVLMEHPVVSKMLSREELEELLRYENYLGSAKSLIERALRYAEEALARC